MGNIIQFSHKCVICLDSGRVSKNLIKGMAPFSFRCNCKEGRISFANFPEYKKENIDYIEKLYQKQEKEVK